jgi:uncharacterized GH25 family protein
MRNRLLLAAGVVAVLVLGIWFWKGRGGDDAPAKEPPATASGTASGTAPGKVAASTDSTGGGGGGGGGEPGGQILIDDDPVGTERLEGQVIDATDDPVGGATVVLSSNPPRSTTTEADGSFVFEGLVGRPYPVAARAPGGVAGPVTVRLTASTPPVILKLGPASILEVEVVDEAGKPLDGATVELRGLDTQRGTTAGGKATIAPVIADWYQLAAWAPGYARSFHWIEVAGERTTTRIALRGGAPVSGRVVAEGGAPIAGARVLYSGASDWSVQPDERLDAAISDEAGNFRFDAVAAGSFRFDARHPDYAPGSSAIVSLDGTTPKDGVLIEMVAGATVSGKVVTDTGAPVASARVRIGVVGVGFASAAPRQVFSDADGAFTVRGLPRRELEAVASGEGGASDTTPVDTTGGDVSGVELVVSITGTIAGLVVDAAGEPLEGIQVSAFPDFSSGGGRGDFASWRLRGFPEDLTDAGGAFTLTGLSPGDYRVRATRSQRRGFRGFRDTVAARTGDTGVKIVLPADGGVKGKVAFDDGSVPKNFSITSSFQSEPFATGDGSFVLDDLAAGDHDLQIRGPGFEPTSVKATVEAGEVSDLGTIVVRKGRTIGGVVVAGGAPVPGATVYVGVQIFGTGSSNKADFGGPPGAQDTKDAVTDEQGRFSISGFGARRDLTIVAEHAQYGRSKAIRLQVGDPGEQDLRILLEAFGSLSGTLTTDGQPSEGVYVSVQSTTAPGAMYGVATGADGTFQLDKLAPDRYKVSGMTSGGPMRGMGFFSKTVDVESGKVTKVDLSIQKGTITLVATPSAAGGGDVAGLAIIASGVIEAKTGREMQLRLAEQGEGSMNFSPVMPGSPVRFEELTSGKYTVCLTPVPSGFDDWMAGLTYYQEHADELPAFCKVVNVGKTPAEQAMTIEVEIPARIED